MSISLLDKWSHEMAYVLGYFAADGCMSSYGSKRIDFESKDKDLLQNIVKLLKLKKEPVKYSNASTYKVPIHSLQFYDSLKRFGFTERKSLTLSYPDIPKEFESSFIRGYFDGDGCVCICSDRHLEVLFCSGSKRFLKILKLKLEEVLHTKLYLNYRSDVCILYINSFKDNQKLFEYMYAHSTPLTRLNRKYERFKNVKKMDCYVIPPLNRLSLMHRGNRYFCLAHLYLKYKNYKKFFLKIRKQGKFITLDNSAAEEQLVTKAQLIKIAKTLKPDEVVSPDVLLDKNKTLSNLKDFINCMKKENLIRYTKVFACPQGSNRLEWLKCYEKMLHTPEVSTIGLSKISVPYCWLQAKNDQKIADARKEAISYLDKNNLIKKPIHFLGMGDPREFQAYNHILLRSTDSCYTILAAYNNIDLEVGFKRIPTPKNYFESTLNTKQSSLAYKNISFLKKQLRGNVYKGRRWA